MDKLKTIAQRLREPSTWAGISIVLTLIGLNPVLVQAVGSLLDVAPAVLQVFSAIGGMGAGVAAVAMPEGASG
jgi:hypothetical protein